MDKILEQVLEWAKCGIYHNYAEGVFRNENLKILKQVEEKFKSTNKQSMPCTGCGTIIYPMEPPVYCYECERKNNID